MERIIDLLNDYIQNEELAQYAKDKMNIHTEVFNL